MTNEWGQGYYYGVDDVLMCTPNIRAAYIDDLPFGLRAILMLSQNRPTDSS